MNMSEDQLRQRAQTLYDMSPLEGANLDEFLNIKHTLISLYGWARGKKLPNGKYSYLEK